MLSDTTSKTDAQGGEPLGSSQQPSSSSALSRSAGLITFLLCLALIGISLAAFGRSLTSYFLADDFGEVAYCSRIFNGNWGLFWSNWTGNFMQIPGMAVYRPWLLVTLLTDFIIWRGNALGYYLTNVLYYAGDAVLLFLLVKKLTQGWGSARSLTTGFLAAALFAVNPLHCESITWVVGRVDTACCFYYLASLLCYVAYLERRSLWLIGSSVLLFLIGLLVKEMAIGLPILATAISFARIPSADRNEATADPHYTLKHFSQQCLFAIKQASPFWVATAVYFLVRLLALGTLLGGYNGAIGDGQASSAFQRWLDIYTYQRVLLPFSVSLFPQDNGWSHLLRYSYAALGVIIALKLLRKEIPIRLMILTAVWVVSTALPIYKLWGVGFDLEGARFCFFLSMSFSAGLVMLSLCPKTTSDSSASQDKAAVALAVAAIACAMFALYKTSLRTNASWVHAGKEVKAVTVTAHTLCSKSDAKDKLIVLGIPKRNAGAHLIYNGATFRTMLQPPFVDSNDSQRFLTFDPIFYGPDQFINSDRIKAALANPNVKGPYVWNSEKCDFVDASLPANTGSSTASPDLNLNITPQGASNEPQFQVYADGHASTKYINGALEFTHNQPGDGVQFSHLAVNPLAYDYLEFEYSLPKNSTDELTFQARFDGERPTFANQQLAVAQRVAYGPHTANQFQLVRIPVSHHWRWFAGGTIRSISLNVPPQEGIRIRNVKLIASATVRPTLSVLNASDDGSGVFAITKDTKFAVDGKGVKGCAKLRIECSKADYFFDQIEGNEQAAAVHKSFETTGTIFNGTLPADFTPLHNYCEIRVRALDTAGKPLAEYSEPVIVFAN